MFMGLWTSFLFSIFSLLVYPSWVSSRYLHRECDSKDDLGYFSIRDCFYIENKAASVILTSGHFSEDHNLGAIIAVERSTNKKIFNASSLIWYLSPKTGQLFNLWEDMFRMEPFSQGPHPRYICLRPRTLEHEERSSWVIEEDPIATESDSKLLVRHEASGRILTFNGVNRSVSLEPHREFIGKGGLSAVAHTCEPFRLKHASSFYQKPMEDSLTTYRSSITDQRWSFVPFAESLFMIITQRKNNSYLAISDSHTTINGTRRVTTAALDIDDPRQIWFTEFTSQMGDSEVIRNLATGQILDAAINDNEENSDPFFDLPSRNDFLGNDDEEEEEEEEAESYKKDSIYLVTCPFFRSCKNYSEYPFWNFDFFLKRFSIHLPDLVKRQSEQRNPSVTFSSGRLVQKKSKEKRMADALSFMDPNSKETCISLRLHKDISNFAISLKQEEGNALMLEHVIDKYLPDGTIDKAKIPSRQYWVRLPLNEADDPMALAALTSGKMN